MYVMPLTFSSCLSFSTKTENMANVCLDVLLLKFAKFSTLTLVTVARVSNHVIIRFVRLSQILR
jgi:hypothetical protein